MVVEMYNDIDTQIQPLELQFQELDLPVYELEPMTSELDLKPVKIDWLEAKSIYVADRKITYRDIAKKYKVSLKQVKKYGSREGWREGRQEVSNLADSKVKESLADQAVSATKRQIAQYQQAQELAMAYVEVMQAKVIERLDNAEREERVVSFKELPNPALILAVCKSLTVAVNGERICLGLPTDIKAPAGWRPPEQQKAEEQQALNELNEYIASLSGL
jgi:hypothetical protein